MLQGVKDILGIFHDGDLVDEGKNRSKLGEF